MMLRCRVEKGLSVLFVSLFVASGVAPLRAQDGESSKLEVTFEETSVVVSGVEPGSRVAWISLASVPHRYWVRDVRREGIGEADAAGIARIELEEEVPPRSVWGVVDLADGAMAWAAPEGFSLRVRSGDDEVLGSDEGSRRNRVFARGVGLELLAVRPRGNEVADQEAGAWGLTVFDGSSSDLDRAPNGGVAVALDQGRPVADSASPPRELRAGDLVLGIDPNSYEVFTLRMPAGPGAPAGDTP
jgi:hypothetical protein